MKQSIVIPALISSFLISAPAVAKSPDWNFVEFGYSQADVDDVDFEPNGFAIQGSKIIHKDLFFTAGYSDLSDELGLVDIDLTQYSIGLGYRSAYSNTTDIYGIFSYENVEAEASLGSLSESEDEGGLGIAVGFRTMLTDQWELGGSIKYVDIAIDNETTFGVNADYYITENFAVGAGYAVSSDTNTFGASLRYVF